MKVRCLGMCAMLLAIAVAGCKGGSDSSSPTTPSASAICSPPVVTICPGAAGAGAIGNDGRPAIGQITVTAGGAPSCRVAVREAIPISFTIVNPNSSATWQILTNTRQSAAPSSGNAGTAGPFQATVQFTTFGGDNITDDTIHMDFAGNGNGIGSNGIGCDFKIYGHN